VQNSCWCDTITNWTALSSLSGIVRRDVFCKEMNIDEVCFGFEYVFSYLITFAALLIIYMCKMYVIYVTHKNNNTLSRRSSLTETMEVLLQDIF
jgi:hypothetical protein